MSHLQFSTGGGQPEVRPAGMFATVLLVLFASVFTLVGLVALVEGVAGLIGGGRDGLKGVILGLIFSTLGLGLMMGALKARKKALKTAAVLKQYPGKPWMLRDDWAQGNVRSEIMAQSITSLIIGVLLCGMGGLGAFAIVPKELENRNYLALFILIFPLVGTGLLFSFVAGVRSRMRYGACFLELAQVPIPAGGTLEGLIQTGARFKLEHGLRLKISCIRRVVTRYRKSSSVSENILWQEEKIYQTGADLPEPEPGRTGIPVHFKLPKEQPACFKEETESVYWQLQASAKMKGPDFSATFYVPVFHVDGADVEEADEPDPTVPLQAVAAAVPAEEVRRDERSKIQVSHVPGGREFYFPAGRNIRLTVMITVIFAAGSGILWLLVHLRAPWYASIMWGVINLFIGLGCFNAWFKSTRITVDAKGVRVVDRFLFFNHTRQFPADQIARLEANAGLTTGSRIYSEIRIFPSTAREIVTINPKTGKETNQPKPPGHPTTDSLGIIIANAIEGETEANWLAQEMRCALGKERQPDRKLL